MKFITSISPNRIERQQHCITSWSNFTNEIVAVQTAGEIDNLKDKFPTVNFIETSEGSTLFDSPKCPRIYELLKLRPGIIINSDISIHTTYNLFASKFLVDRPKVLECGIRYDNRKLHKYGIDVFKITDELFEIYKDTPFGIGQPGWDYYLILEAAKNNFYINAHKKPSMFHHEIHPLNWSLWKLSLAQAFLEKEYEARPREITRNILRLTGR